MPQRVAFNPKSADPDPQKPGEVDSFLKKLLATIGVSIGAIGSDPNLPGLGGLPSAGMMAFDPSKFPKLTPGQHAVAAGLDDLGMERGLFLPGTKKQPNTPVRYAKAVRGADSRIGKAPRPETARIVGAHPDPPRGYQSYQQRAEDQLFNHLFGEKPTAPRDEAYPHLREMADMYPQEPNPALKPGDAFRSVFARDPGPEPLPPGHVEAASAGLKDVERVVPYARRTLDPLVQKVDHNADPNALNDLIRRLFSVLFDPAKHQK